MADQPARRSSRVGVYALVAAWVLVAFSLLLLQTWHLPPVGHSTVFWNAVAVFTLTALVSDAWFLRTSFANVSSSVVFVPLLASVLLFDHPAPTLIAGVTLAVIETFVRRKP